MHVMGEGWAAGRWWGSGWGGARHAAVRKGIAAPPNCRPMDHPIPCCRVHALCGAWHGMKAGVTGCWVAEKGWWAGGGVGAARRARNILLQFFVGLQVGKSSLLPVHGLQGIKFMHWAVVIQIGSSLASNVAAAAG